LRFVLDTDNTVDESNENNNESIVQITCSGGETTAPGGFGFACDPTNGQCYVTTVEKGQFTSIESCMSGCKKQNVAYGCNTQT